MTDTPAALPRHLLYVADPMCSWCYGFTPAVQALQDHFAARLPIQLLMGGLRAGNTTPMTDADKQKSREHWERVAEASGQPFDHAFFDRDGFVYDTEPACRAVVTMRLLNPPIALGYMHRVQQAFYAENRDTTDDDVLADLAADAGIDRNQFLAELRSPEARKAAATDFAIAQEAGITGFPTLLAGEGQQFMLITNGYRPLDGLADALEQWLSSPPPETNSGSDGIN